jgi:intraflagellar transport protein 172
MHLKHIRSLQQAGDNINKIVAISFSPNNQKLAVVGANRVVYLYDDNGEQKDKIPTKAGDPKVRSSI